MRKAIFAAFLLTCATTTFAASGRASITPISNDPYTSAIVIDVATGKVLFEENADAKVYPASVIKLMDFLLIMEWIDSGRAKLTDMVEVPREAAQMGGSQVYLKQGEKFPLDEMLYALSIKSANDVAVALAMHFSFSSDSFVKLMNERAAELGMTSTRFTSVHGLPPGAGQEPDVSTARDIARLSLAVLKHPDALRYTSEKLKWFRNGEFEMRTHNHLLNSFNGCDGLKTGYFAAAGFSIAATAQRNGRRVLAVVMGSTVRQTRDAKAGELMSNAFLSMPVTAEPPPPTPGIAVKVVEVVEPGTEPVAEQSGSFSAGLWKVFAVIGKCLLAIVLVVIAIGSIAVVAHKIRQRGDNWKYDP